MNYLMVSIALLSPYPLSCSEYPPYTPRPHHIIYAPWRENYDTTISKKKNLASKICPLCDPSLHENLIVYRGKNVFVLLASQPYTDEKGMHFLITPQSHIKESYKLPHATYDEINLLTQQLCAFFSNKYHEICINTNQGKTAGASVPDHYHKHIIITTTPAFYNLVHALEHTKKDIDLKALSQQLQRTLYSLSAIKVPLHSQTTQWNHTCYFCHLSNDHTQDKKNLIIHRGKKALITLSHYPAYFGEIDIIPYAHTTHLEIMDSETYNEMNELTHAIHLLLLNILETQESNIGLISYGTQSEHQEHLRQRIIPRKENWITSPITHARHLNGDIKQLYKKLVIEWGRKAKL